MKSCSFFGHRDAPQTEELKQEVRETVERLIVEEGIDTFLFGSRSAFDSLCHECVTFFTTKISTYKANNVHLSHRIRGGKGTGGKKLE